MKKVVSDLLPLIRFPCMEVKAVATAVRHDSVLFIHASEQQVNPSGLLEPAQILDLFTYLASAQTNKNTKLPDSLKAFKAVPRVPRKKPGNWCQFLSNSSFICFSDAFKWSEQHKHSGITISNGGLTCSSSSSNQTVAGGFLT